MRDLDAMLAGLSPVLRAGAYGFCTLPPEAVDPRHFAAAIGMFREAEGVSLILPQEAALRLGLEAGPAFACITLEVASALDAVGLTAAVASALAAEGIACNMVAAHHHDHILVPEENAERALAVLRALQSGA